MIKLAWMLSLSRADMDGPTLSFPEALHEVRQLIDHLRVTAEHNNIGIRRTSVADPGEAARDEAQGVQARKD